MRRFVGNICIFILPILIFAYPADVFISLNLKKSNNFTGYEFPVWNDIFGQKAAADIFLYGSSRAWVHLDPVAIGSTFNTSAYNFGVDGHNFKLQYLRHRIAMKELPKPKLIIHAVDLYTLLPQQDLYNKQQFLPYMLVRDDLKYPLLEYNGFKQIDFQLPIVRYYGQFDAIRESIGQFTGLDKNLPVRIRGFRAEEKSWDGTFDQIKQKHKKYYIHNDPAVTKSFEKYLSECSQKQIKVVLVYTPEYIEGQEFEINRPQLITLFHEIADKHKVPFLDYSKDEISYSKQYFYNATHMNAAGVAKFTPKLLDDLKKLKIKF